MCELFQSLKAFDRWSSLVDVRLLMIADDFKMLENPFKVIEESGIIDELRKTSEGRKIAEDIMKFMSEFNMLPDSEKVKFDEQFGNQILNTLKRLIPAVDSEEVQESFLIYVIIFIVVFTVAGKKT